MPEGGQPVSWASLTHAYGVASDLPRLLAALDDPDRAADACRELDRRIVNQGGVYAATGACVPRLVAYACEPGAAARQQVLELLGSVAAEARAGSGVPVDVAACRDALAAALTDLSALLEDGDPLVREAAAYVLAEVAWRADRLIPLLRDRFSRERARPAKLSIVLAVGHLVGYSPRTPLRRRTIGWLRRRQSGMDPAVRLAALTMAWRTRTARPTDLDALLAALDTDDLAVWRQVWAGVTVADWVTQEVGEDRDARVRLAARLFEVPAGRVDAAAVRTAAAAIATWRSAVDELLPAIAGRLDDPEPVARARAAHLLAALGPAAAAFADRLADALSDPAAKVADLAAWGLSRMDDRRCLPRLRNRALIGTSVFDVVHAHYPRGHYPFSPPGLVDVLAPLNRWAADLLPRIRPAMTDADSYHQRRVLAEALSQWGPAAAPAVPELARLLDTDAATFACGALGAIGAPAEALAHRLFRLVERAPSSRLRAVAAWAHWRVSGDPEPAYRVLAEALVSEHGSAEVRWLADIGPFAAGSLDRVAALARSRDDWTRTEAAHALWRIGGDPGDAVPVLLDVALPLADGYRPPVVPHAVRYLGAIGPPAADAAPLLRTVLASDRRYSYFGDWRAITEDEELRGLASAALATITAPAPSPA